MTETTLILASLRAYAEDLKNPGATPANWLRQTEETCISRDGTLSKDIEGLIDVCFKPPYSEYLIEYFKKLVKNYEQVSVQRKVS